MSLSDFDTAFQGTALPAHYAQFGVVCDYKPSLGAAVSVSGVDDDLRIIPAEREEDHGAPVPGKGRLSSMSRVWRCRTAQLTPKRGGIFVDGDDSYQVEEKPTEDNGEWVFGVVKI